jgi:WD40 repeat protein
MTCAFSRDGLLVSSSRDKTLKIWDIQTGRELFTLTGHNEAICSCGFSPDGLHIVSASMDKTLKLWDVHTGQPQYTLSGHEGWVLACAFSPDGKRVLSGSADGVLKLWDTATGKEMCEYWAGAAVQAVVWHPQSAVCAVGDSVGQLHLLQLEPPALLNS